MKVHFSPVLKPAPPRPRRPEALIWSQIHGRAVPDAALHRRFQPEILQAVEVGEDAVLVFENADHG